MPTLALQETQFYKENLTSLQSMDEYRGIIQSCKKDKLWQNAIRLQTDIAERGLESHKDLGNHLVPMLVECGCTLDAHNIFQKLEYPNEYCWTSLIDGCVQDSLPDLALMMFQNMEQSGTKPSRFTLMALLKACIITKDMQRGQKLHAEIVKKGFDDDLLMGSMLLDVYSVCDLWEDAWVVSMIMLEAFEVMSIEHDSIDPRMLVCCLKACGLAGIVSKCREMHVKVVDDGLDWDPFVGNTLLDMYFKCGLVTRLKKYLVTCLYKTSCHGTS